MKTTSEQLLARAEELEARARALRVSAVEMNGHQTAEKQAKVKELFQAATKIRKRATDVTEPIDSTGATYANRGGGWEIEQLPPLPKKKRYKPSELAPYLLAALDGATRTTLELRSVLKDQGVVLRKDRVRRVLATLPQVETVGAGRFVRWQLKAGTSRRLGRPPGVTKWSAAQHKKFRATMKRKNRETRAKLAKLAHLEKTTEA